MAGASFLYVNFVYNQSFERSGFPVLVDGCVVTVDGED